MHPFSTFPVASEADGARAILSPFVDKKTATNGWPKCLISLTIVLLLTPAAAFSQQLIDFEALLTEPDTFLDGSDGSGGFSTPYAFFPNTYNPDFGGFWSSGWAISSETDSITSGFTNLFSAKPAGGNDGSTVYAVGQQNAVIRLAGEAAGRIVGGIYLTNSTYAHNSMRDGDDFAKKFGGETGDDPDFFSLAIRAYLDGELKNDSVVFFLADYRFDDNSLDYIVDEWTYVDLTPLGDADSLLFTLASSDVGGFGINTPLFFCIDDLETTNLSPTGERRAAQQGEPPFSAFPNPVSNALTVSWEAAGPGGALEILDAAGRRLGLTAVRQQQERLDFSALPSGVYWLRWVNGDQVFSQKILKP